MSSSEDTEYCLVFILFLYTEYSIPTTISMLYIRLLYSLCIRAYKKLFKRPKHRIADPGLCRPSFGKIHNRLENGPGAILLEYKEHLKPSECDANTI
jgi:hypothetical protein